MFRKHLTLGPKYSASYNKVRSCGRSPDGLRSLLILLRSSRPRILMSDRLIELTLQLRLSLKCPGVLTSWLHAAQGPEVN